MERNLDMNNEAELRSATMLAIYMSDLALQDCLGGHAIWSKMTVQIDRFNDTRWTVNLHGDLIHVPGTRHLYKGMVSITLIKNDTGHWQFDQAMVMLHHPKTGAWDDAKNETFVGDLEPGLDNVMMYSPDQAMVDNPRYAFRGVLPAQTSFFSIPE